MTEEQKKERAEACERLMKEDIEAYERKKCQIVKEEDARAFVLGWPGNWRENDDLFDEIMLMELETDHEKEENVKKHAKQVKEYWDAQWRDAIKKNGIFYNFNMNYL